MEDITAILLCGGRGERLKPFTDHLPKPLVPLRGRPILAYLLDHLAAAGISRAVLCTGYKAEAIEEFLRDHPRGGMAIETHNAGVDAEIADRIRAVRSKISGKALVCYGDTLANVDLASLVRTHDADRRGATVTVHPLRSPFGIVEFNEADGTVRSFAEKPELPYWINIGFLVLSPPAWSHLGDDTPMAGFLASLARSGQMGVFRHGGRHLTVNDEKERLSAESEVVHLFNV